MVILMLESSVTTVKSCNVLAIEDDEADIFLLRKAMNVTASRLNIQVELTHRPNGLVALNAVTLGDLRNKLFDLLIVDLNMPILDGIQFLRILRDEFKFDRTRAVVLTSTDQKSIHKAARKAGADAVFVKPHTYSDLIRVVRKIMTFH
jgi:CheY-like chemotaxis protein